MNETIISAEHLYYTYPDGTHALKDVSLTIQKGQKIAVMGANGSGKSTFFLCLNGIHRPRKGKLYLYGEPYKYSKQGLLALRQKVGIVFQDPDNQIFSSDIAQEIAFGPLNLGMPQDLVRKSVADVISELNITSFKNKPTHFLSGGQKKQVSIADILVMKPDLIILDEPSASLDPLHTSLVNAMIESLTDKGITVVVSTHDTDYALSWADEVFLFHRGTLAASGPPETVFQNKELLNQTHLIQPASLKLFLSLCQKGLLSKALPIPKTLDALETYISHVNTHKYYGELNTMNTTNKKAILVVSFGTSYKETREKTIDQIESDIKTSYPDYQIYKAFTSKMIIKKLKERDQLHIPTVCEAMEEMKKDDISDIIIQPTHMMNGIENDLMKADALMYASDFKSIKFGAPLLTSTEDQALLIRSVMDDYEDIDSSSSAVVFMGHGTSHYANSVYAALDYTFKDMGYEHVYVGTVEAYPALDTLLKALKSKNYRQVILTPLMIVAGDHATNDLAGDEEDSWKSIFTKNGFQVSCRLKGLGEYPGIRNMFLKHTKEAIQG